MLGTLCGPAKAVPAEGVFGGLGMVRRGSRYSMLLMSWRPVPTRLVESLGARCALWSVTAVQVLCNSLAARVASACALEARCPMQHACQAWVP